MNEWKRSKERKECGWGEKSKGMIGGEEAVTQTLYRQRRQTEIKHGGRLIHRLMGWGVRLKGKHDLKPHQFSS